MPIIGYATYKQKLGGLGPGLEKLAGGLDLESARHEVERLEAEGFEDVVLQSTHVMNGDERDKMMAQAAPFASRFTLFAIGAPLLFAAIIVLQHPADAAVIIAHPGPVYQPARLTAGGRPGIILVSNN